MTWSLRHPTPESSNYLGSSIYIFGEIELADRTRWTVPPVGRVPVNKLTLEFRFDTGFEYGTIDEAMRVAKDMIERSQIDWIKPDSEYWIIDLNKMRQAGIGQWPAWISGIIRQKIIPKKVGSGFNVIFSASVGDADWISSLSEADDNCIIELQSENREKNKTVKKSSMKKLTPDPDIVIVSALLEELKYLWDGPDWVDEQETPSLPPYKVRKMSEGNIVAISPDTMGLVDMAILCGRMFTQWAPALVIMVGICAGRKSKNAHIGHLIIPKMSFHYQFGAYRNGKIEREIKNAHAAENLVLQAKNLQERQNILEEIRNNAKKRGINLPPFAVDLHTDPMGAADLVVKDEDKINEAIEADRKIIAIDMESYAFMHAAQKAKVDSLVMKTVSDNADHEKEGTANYREYAKFVSVNFAWKFIEHHLKSLTPRLLGAG